MVLLITNQAIRFATIINTKILFMKKIALVLFAGISLVSAKAQIQFGVKAGANLANISKVDGSKTLVNLNAGVLASIPLAGQLSLQPEVVYSGQGVKGDGGSDHLNYINVPVLLKYSLPVGVFFQTGPQIGFLMSAKEKEDGGSSTDIKDLFKSTDFSWALGGGYLIPDVNLGFDVRYNLGLTKLGKSVNGQSGFEGKNGVFQIGVFYLFGSSSGKSSKK